MTFEPIIDYMVLGVVGALALFAWLVLRQMKKEGRMIREAVKASIDAGIVTEDLADGGKAYATSEVGDWVADYIRKH